MLDLIVNVTPPPYYDCCRFVLSKKYWRLHLESKTLEDSIFLRVLQWWNYNQHQHTISMHMRSFLNYFTKMILLNIFQNVAIYWFEYFVSHIMIIPRNDTNRTSLCCIVSQNAFLALEWIK